MGTSLSIRYVGLSVGLSVGAVVFSEQNLCGGDSASPQLFVFARALPTDRQSLRNHLPEHGLTVEDFEAYIVQAEEHDKKAAARLAAVAEEATANATSTPTTPGGVLGSDDTAEKEDPVAKEEEEEDEEIGADASLAESTSPVDVASEAGEAASPAMNDGVAAVAAVAEASDEASAPTDATTLPEASGVAALEPGSVVQAPLSEAKLKKAEKVKKCVVVAVSLASLAQQEKSSCPFALSFTCDGVT